MFNQINLIGNLGSDPVLRYFEDGSAVCNFSLATNRRWKNRDGETEEETTWFRVAVFGKQAESCNQYLQRGRQVHVDGRLKPDSVSGGPRLYQRKDGTMGASFEVVASRVNFLGNGKGNGTAVGDVVADEEIPF